MSARQHASMMTCQQYNMNMSVCQRIPESAPELVPELTLQHLPEPSDASPSSSSSSSDSGRLSARTKAVPPQQASALTIWVTHVGLWLSQAFQSEKLLQTCFCGRVFHVIFSPVSRSAFAHFGFVGIFADILMKP